MTTTPSEPKAKVGLLLVSFAALAGFIGGAFMQGLWLTAVAAAVIGGWSVLFGLFVLAPAAGNLARQRFLEWLVATDPESLLLKRAAVLTIVGEATGLIEAEKQAPADKRPVHQFARSLFDVLGSEGEASMEGLSGSIQKQAKKLGAGGTTGELAAALHEAKAEGIEIPERLEKGLRVASLAEKIAARLDARRSGGQAPGMPPRKRPPVQGQVADPFN